MSGISPLINQFGLQGLNASLFRNIRPELVALIEASGKLADAQGDFFDKFNALLQKAGPAAALSQYAPVARPVRQDSCHPSGSLRANGGVVTTPGGYRIEPLSQFEWKITGPDGKSTRVWGDPHVDEGDGGKWDFKRDSTFVLGDGTRVNVTTAPFGNGMTVTSGLEIISGNDRVLVSDIDKGKGRVGTVTQDGFAHANSFRGDVIVMGRETDDWSFTGREIVGSEDGGERFKLGGELSPLVNRTQAFGGGSQWALSLFNGLLNRWDNNMRSNDFGYNPYSGNDRANWERPERYDRATHVRQMRQAFRAFGMMFAALSRLHDLNQQFTAGRNRPFMV